MYWRYWRKFSVLLVSWSILFVCFWSTMVAHERGQTLTSADFAPTVRGVVWHDQDNDGTQNDEPGLAGIAVTLLDAEQNLVLSTASDISGTYQFTSLALGTYFVKIAGPPETYVTPIDLDGLQLPSSDVNDLGLAGPIDVLSSTTVITINGGYLFLPLLDIGISTGNIEVWTPQMEAITYTISITNQGAGSAHETMLSAAPSFEATTNLTQSTPDWVCDDNGGEVCVIEIVMLEPGASYHAELVLVPAAPIPQHVTRLEFLANAFYGFPPQPPCGCDPIVHTMSVQPDEPHELPDSYGAYVPVWY